MTLAGSRLRLVTWQATPSSITKTSLAVKSATRLPIGSTARSGKRTSFVTIRRRCSCSSAFWGGASAVVCASDSLRQSTRINKAIKIKRRQSPLINTPVTANAFSLLAKRLQRINLRGAPRTYVADNKRRDDRRWLRLGTILRVERPSGADLHPHRPKVVPAQAIEKDERLFSRHNGGMDGSRL